MGRFRLKHNHVNPLTSSCLQNPSFKFRFAGASINALLIQHWFVATAESCTWSRWFTAQIVCGVLSLLHQ